MALEALWNGVTLETPEGLFPLGTDSVALAGFARIPRGSRVADLGCGCGAVSLMLLASDPSFLVTGIELDPRAAAAARDNARINPVHFTVLEGDVRQIKTLLPPGQMEAAVSNPPYFPVGSGSGGTMARSEAWLPLSDLCRAAGWLLRWGGTFSLVHRPERLADLIRHLQAHRLEPKRIQLVRHRSGGPVSLLLLEAKKGAKPDLRWEPDLILYDGQGRETEACRALYHRDGKERD